MNKCCKFLAWSLCVTSILLWAHPNRAKDFQHLTVFHQWDEWWNTVKCCAPWLVLGVSTLFPTGDRLADQNGAEWLILFLLFMHHLCCLKQSYSSKVWRVTLLQASSGDACYSRKKCGVNFECLSWDDKQYILLRPTLRRVYWCHLQNRHVTVCSLDFLGLEYYRLTVSNLKQKFSCLKKLKFYGGWISKFIIYPYK